MQKDFIGWNEIKQKSENIEERLLFKERDIWWCRIGINIGDEENGKGDEFNRPVLILKKFNKRVFIGLPLSTVVKESNYFYHKFHFKGQEQSVIISQIRLFDAKRLTHKMGTINMKEFINIKERARELIF